MATPTASEQDLWKVYANKLSQKYLQGADFSSGENRFYIPPLNAAAIMAGPKTTQAQTNWGVALAGDGLISATNPLYVTSGETYSKRVLSYLLNVQLQSNVDNGLAQVRDEKLKAFKEANKKYLDTMKEAKLAYGEWPDPKADLMSWIRDNYPEFAQAAQERDGAQGALNAVLTQINGPGWQTVQKYIDQLNMATNYNFSNSPYNMEVNPSLIGAADSTTTATKQYRPTYGIDNTYPGKLTQWVSKAGQPGAAVDKIEFSFSEASNYSWSDVGFQQTNFNAGVSIGPFFSASYQFNGQQKTETVQVQNNSSSIKVTISATGIGAFDITPDSTWNPGNVKKKYPNLFPNASKELLNPMVQVRKVIVGYNVSVSITMDKSTYDSIKQVTQKAQSQGGAASASLFGFQLNLGGSGSTSSDTATDISKVDMRDSTNTITFPGANDTFPILLGVLGTLVDK